MKDSGVLGILPRRPPYAGALDLGMSTCSSLSTGSEPAVGPLIVRPGPGGVNFDVALSLGRQAGRAAQGEEIHQQEKKFAATAYSAC